MFSPVTDWFCSCPTPVFFKLTDFLHVTLVRLWVWHRFCVRAYPVLTESKPVLYLFDIAALLLRKQLHTFREVL